MILFATLALIRSPLYSAVDLHITPYEMTRVSINDGGTIVGTREVSPRKYEGYVYRNGLLTSIGTDTPWSGGVNARDEAVFTGASKVVIWKDRYTKVVLRPKDGSQA